jgi:ABC-type spermidine/putrescine transport system permease subunit II
MKLAFLDRKDFWSGAMLIAIGMAAVLVARNYPFGTALRMGPGYFPTVLGSILTLFGLYLVVKALRSTEAIEPGWSLRALIVIPLSLVLFGILMEHAGFVPALMVLIYGSAMATSEFKMIEAALLTVGLTAACVAVFIWGLGLPYPLIAEF